MKSLKSLSLYITLLFIIAVLSSCIKGRGDIVEQNLEGLESFRGFDLRSTYDVEVSLGGQQSIRAVGHQNIIDRLLLNVNSDGILTMDLERGNYRDFQLILHITVPYADYYKVSGSGDMTVFYNETINLDSLFLAISGSGGLTGIGEFNVDNNAHAEISGSGDMNFDLESGQLSAQNSGSGQMNFDFLTNEVNANISGSGNLNFSGFCPTQYIMNSGSGTYKAFNVDAQNTNVELSGSGSAEVRSSSQLNATISGSGSVYYKGTPIVTENITGSGAVVDAN